MKPRLATISASLGLALLAALSFAGSASAVTGADFQPGRIIDDQIFYDASSMSVQAIQSFLVARVPSCDSGGNQPYYGTYGGVTYNGNILRKNLDSRYPAPYTCLKDYLENTSTHDNNIGRPTYVPSGGISAAQIIYNEAHNYNINPQVLIVLLQKESSIVTDDWPWPTQYKTATGYGCPDTAACDSTYFGFYNQVHNAARQFRIYANNPTSYNYAIGLNNIKYHPDPSSCGTLSVNIVNQATASLYIYTPYVPNQAALNNLYGLGDGCSSYGNRNFWRMFNDWFGSTLVPTYSWQITGQYAYSDQTKTVGKSTQGIVLGDRVYVGFTAKNTGTATWTNSGSNPIKVGTLGPIDRMSTFCDSWGFGCNRPATMLEASVPPGGTATFEFWMRASAAGSYNEHFGLVVEGKAWLSDQGLNYYSTVVPAVYSWNLTGQYAYTDVSKTVGKSTLGLLPGDRVYAGFTAQNTGNVTWSNSGANPVNVGMTHPLDRASPFYDSSWLGPNRPARLKEASVAPGGTGTFEFWMNAPAPGAYPEYFSLLAEGKAWFNDPNMNFYSTVATPIYSWQMIGQYAYTDASKTTGKSMVGLHPGDKVYVGFQARNTGNVTWSNSGANPVNVGMTHPLDRTSPFYDVSWLGYNRPARLKEASVPPGAIGTFEFWMDAPQTLGTYREYFSLVSEFKSWFNDPGMNFYSTVQ
jgi:hypothetical protein